MKTLECLSIAIICTLTYNFVFCQETAIINGQIENAKTEFAIFYEGRKGDTVNIDKNGKFEYKKEIEDRTDFTFIHGNEYASMSVAPGDHIKMKLDTKMFDETLSYTGKGSGANMYLIKKYIADELYRSIYSFDTLSSLNESEYTRIRAKFSKTLLSLLEIYVEDSNFINDEKLNINYGLIADMFQYATWYKEYHKDDSEISSSFFTFTKEIELNDTTLLKSNAYKHFLNNYINYYARKNSDKTGETYLESCMKTVVEKIENTKIRDYLLFSNMYDHVSYKGIDNIDGAYNTFRSFCTNMESKQIVESIIEKWKPLSSGKLAPDFDYPDINGNTVMLSQFLGKLVYIDFWATWCRPCMAELPNLEKLQEQYTHNNIVFLSISLDSNIEKWKQTVQEKKLKGVQINTGGWKGVTDDYMVSSIPRFVIIDPEGKIVSAKAPRPSEILENAFGIFAEKK